ncbi:hypothetical protein C8Q79DRAFT_217856 [Trametes meyenii]|nr:hypothetical protein C8Q79DRAFT_217856 [Trametes meyenii]
MSCPLLLPLNDTIVVCVVSKCGQEDGSPQVVQISCKTERPDDIKTIATYYLVQHEFSELALRLVNAHLEDPLAAFLTFEGDLYDVEAKHAPWSFGKDVIFLWGDEQLRACEDKWTFSFNAKARGDSNQSDSTLEKL